MELEAEVVTLYREESSALLRHAQRLAGDRELAREAVQEAFLPYFARRPGGKLAPARPPWPFLLVPHYIHPRLAFVATSMRQISNVRDLSDAELAALIQSLGGRSLTPRRSHWRCRRTGVAWYSIAVLAINEIDD